MPENQHLLSCKDLIIDKAGKRVLDQITCAIFKNSSLGLVGANGAGKSTLFKCWMGIETPLEGEFFWEGQKLQPQHVAQRRSLGLAYLAQEPWLFQDLDAKSNLWAVGELLGLKNFKERCVDLLRTVGLHEHQHQKAKTLSGGEKRRLEIARILLENPKLILLDEPFAGLDPKAIRLLKDLFHSLRQQGISFVISDHQVTHLLEICDKICLLHQGHLLLECDSRDFMSHPLAKNIYL